MYTSNSQNLTGQTSLENSLNVLSLFYAVLLVVHRIVQAFGSIVDTLIGQENFTNFHVIEDDVTLIADQVSEEGVTYLVIPA